MMKKLTIGRTIMEEVVLLKERDPVVAMSQTKIKCTTIQALVTMVINPRRGLLHLNKFNFK